MVAALPPIADSFLPAAQEEAIAHGSGPCLVIAAPGAGKTRVITRRFARLVVEKLAAPHEILALAYNRRAADEMLDRVEADLGPLDGEPPLTTYHAWATALVRRFGWHLGYPATLRLAGEVEVYVHLAAALAEVRPPTLYNPARPYDGVDQVRRTIERCKQELVEPEGYLEHATLRLQDADSQLEHDHWGRHVALARIYGCLQRRYHEGGVMDHDDAIAIAATLLERVPAARESVAGIAYVMVDEYQDTNTAQAVMLDRLTGHSNILVVADDDQSIYRFRGASRANIERFRRRWPERRELRLLDNHRSTEQIVAVAQAVVAESASRENKEVRPRRGPGAPVRIVGAPTQRDEAEMIARLVAERCAGGVPPSEIAVLAYRRADLDRVAERLRAQGIPYVATGSGFFVAREIKALFALLEAIIDPDCDQAVLQCLQLPAWRVSPLGRVALNRALRDGLVRLVELLRHGGAGLDTEDGEAARRCAADLLDLHVQTGVDDAREVFEEAMTRTLFPALGDLDRPIERAQFAANVSRFFELIDEFCVVRPSADMTSVVEYLRLLREAGGVAVAPIDVEVDAVRLSTIHGAKGLEWPHVIVMAAASGKIPSDFRGDVLQPPGELAQAVIESGSESHLEEQRRLFYVALTRARETLTVTWARRYGSDFKDRQLTEFLAGAHGRGLAVADVVAGGAGAAVPRRRRLPELLAHDGSLRLSYSAIEAYRRCPKRFAYDRLWHTPPLFSADGWYGERLHGTLRRARELHMAGRTVDAALVADLWRAEWDAAPGPRGRLAHLYGEGLDRLQAYVATPLWSDAVTRSVEHRFSIALAPPVEWYLVGRIDRLDECDDGCVGVVDYKSGHVGAGSEALERNLQLKVYAAAALAATPRAERVRCSIHNLQTATAESVTWDRDQVDRHLYGITKRFQEIAAAHAAGSFPTRPSRFTCGSCPYRLICAEREDDA